MIYPENFEHKIGFDKVREQISARCISLMGREQVDAMRFITDLSLLSGRLDQTAEYVRILQEEPDALPTQNFFDVREALQRAAVPGLYLSEAELFDLRRSLDALNTIIWFFSDDEDEQANGARRYPHLAVLADGVSGFPGLVRRIDTVIDIYGQVKDTASPELNDIRRELASASSSISRKLMSILHAAQSEGYVDKDVNPTMRDGRLVIPVAPALKRKIKGIVHDESATGKTVFIEPAEVVEANNRVRELEGKERREIIRILSAFSAEMRPHIPDILRSYSFLGIIDFIRAKALTAIAMEAIRPNVKDEPYIDWVYAVHPLLRQSLERHGKKVVPLSLELNQQQRILLISGPNAGGKSVCLKTVGLLQYMMQCGLLVPMKEAGSMGIFRDIFIDIGDEQSIEDDLSTYSSHLLNMKNVLKGCGPDSLVLIDEFGSGTDPLIGGAIAEAVLSRINDRKAFGVITTHYHNLKQFAENHEGVVNGAMLYDRNLMQALFQLQVGQPGSSFAVEIARKIGLPEEVIAEASDIVGNDYIQSDKYLQDIVRDKRYWEQKRQKVHQQEKELEQKSQEYDEKTRELKQKRHEVMEKARSEASNLLQQANARIEKTIKDIKEAQAEKEATRQIRKEHEAFKAKKIERSQPKPPTKQEPAAISVAGGKLEVGSLVRLKGQQTVGEVLAVSGRHCEVAFGLIRSHVDMSRLEPVSKNQAKKEAASQFSHLADTIGKGAIDMMSERRAKFKQEIDVRGMRADEALQAVMYFIDDAILLSMSEVRILHGTGTGALRQAIRQYLSTVPGISSYHDEHVQLGGVGITVVEID